MRLNRHQMETSFSDVSELMFAAFSSGVSEEISEISQTGLKHSKFKVRELIINAIISHEFLY